jgi:hypothetical protein
MYAERMAAEARAAGDEARGEYWDRIARVVDKAPPLSAEQRDRLAVLLRSDAPVIDNPVQRPRAA